VRRWEAFTGKAAVLEGNEETFAEIAASAPARRVPALDRDHHLVQVPGVRRSKPAQVAREGKSELEDPSPNRLVGDVEAAFGQELLHVAVAQGEPQIKPYGMPDDLGRKAEMRCIPYPTPRTPRWQP
jgi:hypothetical protein